MSIVLSQQPQAYMPAYNPIIYQGIGAASASPGYYYKITIQDMITGSGSNLSYRLNPLDDYYFIFDASPYVQNYMTHSCIINNYGWKKIPSVRKFQVSVAEYNDANPEPTPIATTTYNFYAWNGVIDTLDFPSYNYTSYIYDSTASPIRRIALTDSLSEKVYPNRSNLLYVLSETNTTDVNSILIVTNPDGASFYTASAIANPYSSISDYKSKYVGIDVGLKGLANISSGLVTGTYPIIDANVTHYEVIFYEGGIDSTTLKRYYLECEPKFTVYTIHALFQNGNYRSIHFSKQSEETITKDSTTYKQIPFENISNIYTYSTHSSSERVLGVTETKQIKLRTDWITEAECLLYKQIVTSPSCYMDNGGTDYISVIPVSNSYRIIKKANQKMFALELDFRYSLQNFRQRG